MRVAAGDRECDLRGSFVGTLAVDALVDGTRSSDREGGSYVRPRIRLAPVSGEHLECQKRWA